MNTPLIEKPRDIAEIIVTPSIDAFLEPGSTAEHRIAQKGVRVRLVTGVGSYHYRRGYLGYKLGFPYVEGRRVDESKKPWEKGNFRAETRSASVMPDHNYEAYGFYEVELPEVQGIRKASTIYCRCIDPAKKLWDPGNCEVIRGEMEDVEYQGRTKRRPKMVTQRVEYESFSFVKLTKLDATGNPIESVIGRAVNPAAAYWDPSNLEVLRVTPAAAPGGESTSAWIPLDANTDFPQNVWKHERISPKAHRTSALEESKHYLVDTASVVSVTAWDSEAPVEATRFALVTGPGLWKALEAKIASKVEDKNDPTRYWLTLVYVTETDPKLLQPGVIPRVAWMVRAEALGASEVTPPAPAPAAVVDDTPPTPPAAPPSPEQMTIDPDAPPFNLDEIPF